MTPQNATEHAESDVFGKRALSASSPSLGRIEDLTQAIASKLDILIPDLQDSDPFAPEARLELIAHALSKVSYMLSRRQQAG
jgi:hypothetical protein